MGNFEKFQNDLAEAGTEELKSVAELLLLRAAVYGRNDDLLEDVMDELTERTPLFETLHQSHLLMRSTLGEEAEAAGEVIPA